MRRVILHCTVQRFWAVVLCCVFIGEVRADEGVLTLEQVTESVESYYPAIAAALHEQAEAQGLLKSAQGGFDPVLKGLGVIETLSGYPKQYFQIGIEQPTPLWGASVLAGYRFGSGLFAPYDGKLETNDAGELRIGLRLPLLRDGYIDRRRAAITQAEINVSLSAANTAQQKLETLRAARLRYWEWAAARARLDVAFEWLDLAQKRDEQLAARAEHGDIPRFESLENKRTVLQRETARLGLERDFVQASNELALYVRDESGQVRNISHLRASLLSTPEIPEHVLAEATRTALKHRPELTRLALVRERNAVDVSLAKNQQLPGIDLVGSASKDFGSGDPKLDRPVVEVGLTIDVPIPNRGQWGRKNAALANVRKTLEFERLMQDRIRADVQIHVNAYQTARERVRASTSEFKLAAHLAEGELKRFNAGESTLLLVNLREQASAEAHLRYIEAILDTRRAEAQLKAAVASDLKS